MSIKPYQPCSLPLDNLDYRLLLPLVGQANAELARYDGLLQGIPNPAVMLSPLTNQEAVLSSKIEGTQATVDEVLEYEAGMLKEGEKLHDIQEITNYRKALFEARNYLLEYPLRLSFVLALHKILLDSVRGANKTPGEFRRTQNWIGTYGSAIEQATYIPPNPLQLQDYLLEWERYLASDDIDFLIQTAVMHAQFELLHPFNDGNGRIGRILIPLFLYQKNVLSQPMFYLSEYLESHREEYYARLGAISSDNDWNSWIAFFLTAVQQQAQSNSQRVVAINSLYDETKQRIHEITRSQYTVHLLDAIFTRPIFRTTELAEQLHQTFDIHKKTLLGLLQKLRKGNLLKELQPASGQRPAVFCFPELINIAEGKKVL